MKKVFLFSILIALALVSCRKRETKVIHEDAPNNAQGIVYSIQPEDWTYDGDSVLYSTLDVPELSDEIFDHGAVIVYISFTDGMFEALPEVFDSISYNALHYPAQIDVEMRSLDFHQAINPPSIVAYVKVVLINAEAVAIHPNVNFDDYGEVKKAFHLR